jgi:hypothetical protein
MSKEMREQINKVKNFGQFLNENIITNSEYSDYLEDLKLNTNWDDERAKEDLDYYINIVSKLQKDGGKIYRLVWLFDEKGLNTENLGYHWNIDGDFDNFYNSLENRETDEDGNERKPFLIIAKINPNSINIDDSFSYYTELPTELEINLIKPPIKHILIPFVRGRDYSHIDV